MESIKLTLPHKRVKACLIRHALKNPSKPVYWSTIGPIYTKIKAINGEMLKESKLIVKSLYEAWQALKRRRKEVTRTQYEEERNKLRAEAWKALDTLRAKYDEKFEGLERSIEAYFRGQMLHTVLNALQLNYSIAGLIPP
ncbi:MAG: hypothetical protein QXH61_07935 [Candidatus Nezhaarchaeales archaeon]